MLQEEKTANLKASKPVKQSLDTSEIADLEVSGHVKFQAIYEIHQILSYPFAGRLLSRLQFLFDFLDSVKKTLARTSKGHPISNWIMIC